ncbi:NADH-quinone oxidoreductase subunit C [uncultured Ilumatobacter sp.]|jgi:NADH-quinone oxidoreductase subunit C|uniref:NADH-quinone oxidoreductase subunit C n=1 Tax=Ilumatobacter sp. TaxID=1967498 RepID=UPI0030A4C578|tara:strand:- start:4964 stop:5488 length:525 start_codon:yes stop_codon:yes gene_type:complete
MSDDASTAQEQAEVAESVAPAIHGCPVTDSNGQEVIHASVEQYLDVVKALADEGYIMCVDLCGIDYLEFMDRALPDDIEPQRFEVVINLLDMAHRRRTRLRVQVPEADPTVASLFEIYPGTEAMEREAYDMFGILFADHPDLTRILMPEDWEGHPLRKDYDVGRIPVQFKGANA